jgi:hypothetical protein
MLANEELIKAKGWGEAIPKEEKGNPEYLEFANKVAKTFGTRDGKAILEAFIQRYLLVDIVTDTTTQFGAGRRQGHADVVKQILAQIEISNKA